MQLRDLSFSAGLEFYDNQFATICEFHNSGTGMREQHDEELFRSDVAPWGDHDRDPQPPAMPPAQTDPMASVGNELNEMSS